MQIKRRIATVGLVAGLGVLALAAPAAAHVEVEADKDTAGATDVTLTFHGEAENSEAGIRSERVVLPTGIAPADVTLVEAPSGWRFTTTGDGFTVAGKALAVGADATWSVKIAKLPDGETRLSFKTLETYGDGEVSRWIEIQEKGADEPDNPAPLVTLKPGPSPVAAAASAAAPAPASAPASTGAAADLAPSTPATPVVAEPAATDDGGSNWWIWVVVVVVVAAVAGFVLSRRRKQG